MLNQKMIAHHINDYYFANVQQVVAGYDSAWTNHYACVRIESSIAHVASHMSTARQLIDTFEWLHHAHLLANSNATDSNTEMPLLAKELPAIVQQLADYTELAMATSVKLHACENNVFKRIEWARNTTPALADTSKSFELRRKQRNEQVSVSGHILSHCF